MGRSPQGSRRSRRRDWARLADLSTLGLVFPAALVLGYLGGRYLGGLLDAERLGGLLGALLGIGAGFYNLIQVVKRLDREDARPGDSSEQHGEQPRD
jgi:F0F1-type ATP synthase assembly protein I